MFIHQLSDPKECAALTKLCFLTALSSRDPGQEEGHLENEFFKEFSEIAVEAVDYSEQEMLGRLIMTFMMAALKTGNDRNADIYSDLIREFFHNEVKPVLPPKDFIQHLSEELRETIFFDIANKLLEKQIEKKVFAFFTPQHKKLFFFECCTMSHADGACSENEKRFLYRVAEALDIEEDLAEELAEQAVKYLEVFAETVDIINE